VLGAHACECDIDKHPQAERLRLFLSAHRGRNAKTRCFVRQRTERSPEIADGEAGFYAGLSAQPSMENGMKHAMDVFTTDQLVTDINAVLADAEALLSATADQGGEQIALVRAKAESSLRLARRRMVEVQTALRERTQEAVRLSDDYVHENPWNAIGAAAGVGLLVGFLLGRR